MKPDWLGWLATVLVVVSYLVKSPVMLRRIQGTGATLWLLYGVLIHSQPVIVANIVVVTAALVTSFRPTVARARG
ncbi:MAG: hypothetical protein ACHQX4_08470 [Gemmatimonadales bacterium]